MKTKVTRDSILLFIGLQLVLITLALSAQDLATIRSESRLVLMPFVARDANGQVIRDIRIQDLEVREDGKVKPIEGLWRSDLALSIAILLDVSGSQVPRLEEHRRAIGDALAAVLHPADEVSLISFNATVRLTVPATKSVQEIDDALQSIIANRRNGNPSQAELYGPALGKPCQGGQKIYGAPCGNSILWTAVARASQYLSKSQGRKVIVLITDGDDSGSDQSLSDAIRKSQESETPIFCIAYRHAHRGRTNKSALKNITEASGGMVIDGDLDSLDQHWRRIRQELESLHVLAFRPTADTPGFHRVQITSPIGHRIRSRPGYFLQASGTRDK